MRTKRQNHSLVFRGLILVLAFALTLIYMPFGNVMSLVRAATNYTDYNYMTLGTLASTVKKTVTKGGVYEIAAGYVGGNAGKVIGKMDADSALSTGVTLKSSNVTVKYSSKVVGQIADGAADTTGSVTLSTADGMVGEFTAEKQGEYTITYAYTYALDSEPTKLYTNSYDFVVTSTLTEAELNFDTNSDVIFPAHIDKNGDSYKDVYLPMPEVVGEDGEAQVAGTDYTITTNAADVTATGNFLVVSARAAGSVNVIIAKNTTTNALYIAGTEIAAKGAGEYTITYQYYEKGQFVVSTTKTTKIHSEDNPYYTDYELKFDLASSFSQDSGETGVEKELPAAKGLTASTSTPASEEVDIHYTVKVLYKQNASDSYAALDTTKYAEVLNADGTLKDPTVFKPLEDGSYTFVYTITDFYGNTVSTAIGRYHWEDVQDTTAPTPIIYDAASYDEDEGYVDGTKLIPTRVLVKNVVVYAIGMDDNASKVGDTGVALTRRVMTDDSTVEFTISDYDAYNLIFDYDFASLFNNNYRLKMQIEADGIDTTTATEAEVLAWLKSHNYLIVTDESAKTVAEGYAYIAETKSFGQTQKTYYIHYVAKDASGNENEISKTLRVYTTIADDQDPVVKFPTTLADRYLPTDVITFDAPTVTDTNRTSTLAEKVLYRLLNGTADVDVEGATYVTYDGHRYIDITDDTASTYSIDLSKGEGATSLEIVAYAYDDFGRKGVYTETVKVSSVVDNYPPVLGDVVVGETAYRTDAVVTLPTVTVSDDQAGYLTYDVKVTYTDADDKVSDYYVENVSRRKYVNEETGAGKIVVTAGTFNPQYAGSYQASVAVTDFNNKAVVVFAHYTVTSRGAVVQSPKLNTTLASETVDLANNPVITLPTPTVNFELEDSVTYDEFEAGVSTETYVVRGINKDGKAQGYETTYGEEGSFTPTAAGNYDIVYSLDVVVYKQAEIEYVPLTFDATEGTVGDYYLVSGTTYRVAKDGDTYVITNGTAAYGTVSKDENGNVVKKVDGTVVATFGNDLDDIDFYEDFRVYHIESDIVTITVTDNATPTLPEMNYVTAMTVEEFEADGITVYGIESLNGFNAEKSQYKISWKLADGSSSSVAAKTGENALVDYTLIKDTVTTGKPDGTYTITYTVVGLNGKSATKSYTIIVGDNQAPEITIPSDMVKSSYEYGKENLVIDTADLGFSDVGEGVDLTTLEIKLLNTSTNEEVEATVDGTVYTFKFADENSIGSYKLSITIADTVGNTTTETRSFEVTSATRDTTPVYQIVGIILIVVSVLVLVGVIVYFIISKVKLDKELKKK